MNNSFPTDRTELILGFGAMRADSSSGLTLAQALTCGVHYADRVKALEQRARKPALWRRVLLRLLGENV